MILSSNSKDNSDKKDEIVAAAQERFGQYGFKKTSMLEIANDLDISKGLLYYYFPDKEHLYNAVVEKEFIVFKSNLIEQLEKLDNPFEMLKTYVHLRLTHFNTLFNLSRFKLDEMKKLNKVMCQTRDLFQKFEMDVIKDILKKGNEQQLLKVNPVKTAELLFDLLRGLRIAMIKDKQFFYLTPEEFNLLAKKNEAFIDIFIAGLQHQAQS